MHQHKRPQKTVVLDGKGSSRPRHHKLKAHSSGYASKILWQAIAKETKESVPKLFVWNDGLIDYRLAAKFTTKVDSNHPDRHQMDFHGNRGSVLQQ